MRSLVDLLLPARCAGCVRPGSACCVTCAAPLSGPAFRARPRPCPDGLPAVWACAGYDGSVRALLLAHKERGRHDLTRLLSAGLVRAAEQAVSPELPVLVIPVPSRRTATRQRGYDHTRRLADGVAEGLRRLGRTASAAPLLVVARRVADQGELDARERARNLQHAYRAQARLPRGVQVLVIDDVITTGSTLVEAARALRSAGAVRIAAAVVAATQRTGFGSDSPRDPPRY